MKIRALLSALAMLVCTCIYSQKRIENQQVMILNKDGLAISNRSDDYSGASLYLHTRILTMPLQ